MWTATEENAGFACDGWQAVEENQEKAMNIYFLEWLAKQSTEYRDAEAEWLGYTLIRLRMSREWFGTE